MVFRKMTSCKRILAMSLTVAAGIFLAGCSTDQPKIDLVKTGSPKTYTQVGDIITYTYSLKINGNLHDITIKDDLVELDCTTPYSCRGTYEITKLDIFEGSVTNTAVGSAVVEGGCGEGFEFIYDSTEFTVTLREVLSLHLTKMGSPVSFSGPGEEISYTYTVENTGNKHLDGPVTIDDNLVRVTCPPKNFLDIFEIVTCTASYTTTAADVAALQVENKAVAFVGGVFSNEESFIVHLVGEPDLTLTKTANRSEFIDEGQLISYTFEIENTGNVPVSPPFAIDDPRLEQWDCPDGVLDPGEKMTCTGMYYTRYGDVGDTLKNCATASGIFQGEQVTTNSACVEIQFIPYRRPMPTEDTTQCGQEDIECYCKNHPEEPICQ